MAIGEIQVACEEAGYALLITADHGNAERMIDEDGQPVTKHTTYRGGWWVVDGGWWWVETYSVSVYNWCVQL